MLEHYLGTPKQADRRPPPLDMLIATVLSQNTNDKNSHRAYTRLRDKYRTWARVADAPTRSIEATIKVGGIARQKARTIRDILSAAKLHYGRYSLDALRGKSDNEVIDELLALKGVGAKTAACVLLFSLGRDVFPVDTHVHRVCTRLGLVNGSRSAEQTFQIMRELVPRGKAYSLHTNLIRFGRKVCRSQHPRCEICPLYSECEYQGKHETGVRLRRRSRADHDFMLLDNV